MVRRMSKKLYGSREERQRAHNVRRRERYANDPKYRAYRLACTRYNYPIQKKYDQTPAGRASRRGINLRRKYGFGPAVWDAMFTAQGCKCLVCGVTEPRSKVGWHTHHTGIKGTLSFKVHGILCQPCNHILMHHVTPALLRKLANFLESYYV